MKVKLIYQQRVRLDYGPTELEQASVTVTVERVPWSRSNIRPWHVYLVVAKAYQRKDSNTPMLVKRECLWDCDDESQAIRYGIKVFDQMVRDMKLWAGIAVEDVDTTRQDAQ